MLPKKILSKLLIASLSSIILVSCAHVPNVPICKELTPDRGYCSWTLSSGGFMVDDQNPYAFDPGKPDEKFTWWEYKPVMMSLPPHSWGEIKKYLIKQCRNKKCREGVGQWMARFEEGMTHEKLAKNWNEPEFKEEARDLLHRLTAPSEQSVRDEACSGGRGQESDGEAEEAGLEGAIQNS